MTGENLQWSFENEHWTEAGPRSDGNNKQLLPCLHNLIPRADFVLFRFDFTEQSTLETTPEINQFDWLMTLRLCHKLTV